MKYYENKNITLYHGDNNDEMKVIPNDSIDLIVTDPPYGITFMGKQWDIKVPSIEIWKECLRTLKPGAFAFIMSSPRQDVLSEMIYNIRHAGFDTNFTSIYWTYASGFPKAMNIGKAIDKRFGTEREVIGKNTKADSTYYTNNVGGSIISTQTYNITKPTSEKAKEFDGSYAGFQPKPAVEIIIVAMKPLSEKSFIDQTLKNGKGITWLDNCRIPYSSKKDYDIVVDNFKGGIERASQEEKESWRLHDGGWRLGVGIEIPDENKGRFPANLLVSDDILNDGNITKTGICNPEKNKKNSESFFGKYKDTNFIGYDISGGDSGSFSRYFDLDKWFNETIKKLPEDVQKVFPFLIVSKAAKSERNEGCDDTKLQQVNDGRNIPPDNAFQRGITLRHNFHPTVKPLKLISYLITLGSRPKDVILDPFVGSGTTCISANMIGRKSIGIEINEDYINIAKSKIIEVSKQVRFT